MDEHVVTTIAPPHVIGVYTVTDVLLSIAIRQDLLFAGYEDAFSIADVSSPSAPVFVSADLSLGFVTDILVKDDNLVLIATDSIDSFIIVDVSNPINPTLVGSYGTRLRFVSLKTI